MTDSILRSYQYYSTTTMVPFPVPQFVGMLDTYSGAAVAYSLRRLSGTYAGSAVRIRRSSDNSEQDFGFASNGDFDAAGADTFVGAGDGLIVTWYDQSGNGIDVTQATSGNQPRIFSSGTLDVRNSLASAYFGGAAELLSSTDTAGSNDIFAVAAIDSATFSEFRGLISGDTSQALIGQNGSAAYSNSNNYTADVDQTASAALPPSGALHQVKYTRTSPDVWTGVSLGVDRLNFPASREWIGWISEAIVYPTALSGGNRTAVCNNQKAYYGTA